MTERRSIYCFAGGGYTPETLVKVDGIRCAATLAHPTYGLFVGGWEDSDWLERIRPLLEFPIVLVEEAEPIPDYPPSWPTRIVHRRPSNMAYHAFGIEDPWSDGAAIADPWRVGPSGLFAPEVEEATITADNDVLCLFGADRREDIQAVATNPYFVYAFAYRESEALV